MREYARVGTNEYICLYVLTCMYEYVNAYMIARMMLAYKNACVCLSFCLSVLSVLSVCMCVYMFVCVFLYMHACACVRLCVCINVCPLLFF